MKLFKKILGFRNFGLASLLPWLALAGFLWLGNLQPVVADPPGPEVELILDKFELIRPQDRDLSLFKLDWEKTLKSALARAAREDRPVLLILVRNSNGDIFQGHC